MKIAVRVDSSRVMGTGHVRRCLSLSEVFRRLGHEVVFYSRNFEGNIISLVREKGFPVHVVEGDTDQKTDPHYLGWLPGGWHRDATSTLKLIEGEIDMIIVDHYALDAKWHSALRSKAKQIMVIDDLANRYYDCDIILDQNYVADYVHRYDSLVPGKCLKLLGPEHVLLSKPIFNLKPRVRTSLRNALVSFGGSDPTGETKKALEAVSRFQLNTTVVLGSHTEDLNGLKKTFPRFTFHQSTESMARLIDQADLAIGGGGTSIYERCISGLPSIVVAVADNQVSIVENLAKLNAIDYIGRSEKVDPEKIKLTVRKYLDDPKMLQRASEGALHLWSNKPLGVERIVELLLDKNILLRRATLDDSQILLLWRNDPRTRENSINNRIITELEHAAWIKSVLENSNIELYICEVNGKPVGTVRFESIAEGTRELSWTVAPEQRGRGLGTAIVAKAIQFYAGRIVAKVKNENMGSIKIVQKLGFTKVKEKNDLSFWEKY